MSRQTTDHLVMVRPRNFAMGSPTYVDNSFQTRAAPEDQYKIAQRAVREFDRYAQTLRDAGLRVTVLEDLKGQILPDSVFPNNWFSTHEDGLLITYPMFWPQRRLERRADVVKLLDADHLINRTLALEHWENRARILEGTGSLVLDRPNRIAYVCFSERATPRAIADWCAACDYEPVTFNAHDSGERVVFHTNVMMAVGTEAAVVCLDSIRDPGERQTVVDRLTATSKRIIEISLDQVDAFCGNTLEVSTPGGPAWVMSSGAHTALTPEQLDGLGAPVIHAPLTTIETFGGGSARCMIAEIFLPRKN